MYSALDRILKNLEENYIVNCDVSRLRFTLERAERLAEGLKKNTYTKELDLFGDKIGNEGAIAVANALYENKTLLRLHLGDNDIGSEGAIAIGNALRQNKTLVEMGLENNNIGIEGAIAIGNVLSENTTLLKIRLGGNSIGNEGAIAIANALRENRTLVQLNLIYNNIGSDGVSAIASVLGENETHLEELDLRSNIVGNEGAIALASALRENKTLEKLFLYWNYIGDEGCIRIAEALKGNTTLRELHVDGNLITSRGAIEIGNVLEFSSLTELNLSENDLRDEGVEGIAEGMKKNRHLQKLFLRNCRFADHGLISISDALKENFTLRTLRMDNYEGDIFRSIFTDEGVSTLVDALDVNLALTEVELEGTGVSREGQNFIDEKTRRNLLFNTKLEEFNVSDLYDSVPFRKTKIILLGDSGSGKTHTVRELTSEEYVEERDRYTEALEINTVNSMTWEKDNLLTARELSLASLRGELVAEEVHLHINEGGNERIEGNEEERRVLDIEEEDRVSQRSSYSSHLHSLISRDEEKSSLSDSDERIIVADIYDFGGHEVYRVVSQFFMNNWAVYLVVLNLEDYLDELKSQLSYYVSVVQTFVPEARICVVGTHSATRSVEKDELEEILEEVAGEADCPVFLVENGGKDTGEEGEDEKDRLKATIKAIIENLLREKRPAVPLLWTRMLDKLRRKRENEGIQVVTKDEMREIELGRAFDKDDKEKAHPSIVKFPPEDVDAFIQRMKEMGMLYHFDTPIELNDLVILDPNWLVEGMKGVVTIKEAKKLKKENPMYATNPQWREFLSSGILTSQLLELIASVYWNGKEEWKSYFMNLLQQQNLLYRIPDIGDGEVKYVVPPLLPRKHYGSLPRMTDFLTVKLERCYPPLEVYKLSFGLVKRRGWSYDSRSKRYSILLRKEIEIEKVTMIRVSCDSSGMKQELSISILEQHKKSTLGEAVMDDILSESTYEVNM